MNDGRVLEHQDYQKGTMRGGHDSLDRGPRSLERRKAHLVSRLRRRFSWWAWERFVYLDVLSDEA